MVNQIKIQQFNRFYKKCNRFLKTFMIKEKILFKKLENIISKSHKTYNKHVNKI